MTSNPMKLQYRPTGFAVTLFYLLLLVNIFLFGARTRTGWKLDFILHMLPDFYSHISNFSISCMLVSAISLIWLLQGAKLKLIVWLCITAIITNIVVELYVTVLNTPDIHDAQYGIAGIAIAFVFAVFVKKFGLKPYA